MRTCDLNAIVTLKTRRGLVTHFGRGLCHGLVGKIGWKRLINPFNLGRFLWIYTGLLGSRINISIPGVGKDIKI